MIICKTLKVFLMSTIINSFAIRINILDNLQVNLLDIFLKKYPQNN